MYNILSIWELEWFLSVHAVQSTHHADGEIIVDYVVGHRAVLVGLHFDGLLLLLELEMLLLLLLQHT